MGHHALERNGTDMKQNAPQNELAWTQPEAFSLVTEQTTDGDRIGQEQKRRESDRKQSEKLQTQFV